MNERERGNKNESRKQSLTWWLSETYSGIKMKHAYYMR